MRTEKRRKTSVALRMDRRRQTPWKGLPVKKYEAAPCLPFQSKYENRLPVVSRSMADSSANTCGGLLPIHAVGVWQAYWQEFLKGIWRRCLCRHLSRLPRIF